jgi:hypothetical protein
MSNSEENPSIGEPLSPPRSEPATVVSNHEGEDGMDSRSMTVGRYEEIRRAARRNYSRRRESIS